MIKYNFDPQVIEWIKSFLKNRSCQVCIRESLSEPFCPDSGVPQGSVLGPILFLIFINDLATMNFGNIKIKLFADDLKIFYIINTLEDALLLQKAINLIENWANENHLALSAEKTNLLRLGKNPIPYIYTINGVNIREVMQIRDLGIIIDSKLSFEPHINETVSKGTRLVMHLFKSLPRLPIELYVRLYNSYVLPVVEYGSEIFNPSKKSLIKRMEEPQKLFTRILCSKNGIPYSNYIDRLKALSLDSLEFRRAKIDLSMTFKLIMGFVDVELSHIFTFHNRFSARYHRLRLYPSVTNNINQGFFTYRVTKIWNDLPISLDPIIEPSKFTSWLNSLPKNIILPSPVFDYFIPFT